MKLMKIHNVRLGFACNSSSSHSLLILPNGKKVEDNDVENNEFGWGYFTAASPEAKRQYLALQLYYNLQGAVNSEIARVVANAWAGCDLKWIKEKREYDSVGPEGHIDHQSIYSFPGAWAGRGLDKEFIDDFSKFLLRSDLAILGGNDNDGDNHPLHHEGTEVPAGVHIETGSSSNVVARKDPSGFWTLFNRESGHKMRCSFGHEDPKPAYAHAPELVDVKITNRCSEGCSYCYQDSKPDGEQALRDSVYSLAHTLGELRVFEVAIGGGEPTQHPNFVETLESFRDQGVVPNFTTRNLDWLEDSKKRARIVDACGAFAVSVNKPEDIERLDLLLRYHGVTKLRNHERSTLQYVLGTSHSLRWVLEAAQKYNFLVTLFGFKMTGRGKEGTKGYYNDKDWLDVVKSVGEEHKYIKIGIDTAIAKEFSPQIEKAGMTDTFFHTDEGAFSMYIDLVEGKWGPSSYEPEKMKTMPSRPKAAELLEVFHSFRGESQSQPTKLKKGRR